MLSEMQTEDGTPRVLDDVFISSIGSSDEEKTGRLTAGFGAERNGPKIGPEFTFGIYLRKSAGEPILIIKTAWGGKSIHTDFRPPSAGPYVFSEARLETLKKQGKDIDAVRSEKVEATGHYYRLMVDHVKHVMSDIKRVYPEYDESRGAALAGFVWFQGWNDMVDGGQYPQRDQPGGYDEYSELLTHFIRDVRRDLSAPELPFVIGVMGVGGPVDQYSQAKKRHAAVHQNFRDAMAAPALRDEFRGNVVAVRTERYWDMELAALKEREDRVKQTIKERRTEGLSGDALKALETQLMNDEFDERERLILKTAVSNFEFHYLGCAKIMAGIGRGFAIAMDQLQGD